MMISLLFDMLCLPTLQIMTIMLALSPDRTRQITSQPVLVFMMLTMSTVGHVAVNAAFGARDI